MASDSCSSLVPSNRPNVLAVEAVTLCLISSRDNQSHQKTKVNGSQSSLFQDTGAREEGSVSYCRQQVGAGKMGLAGCIKRFSKEAEDHWDD